MSPPEHHEDDLSSDPPQAEDKLGRSAKPNDEEAASSSGNNINNLLDEGYLDQKQRRIHRGVATWAFGIFGVIVMIATLIPMEAFLYTLVFKPNKVAKYAELLQDKFYLFTAVIILICSTVPLTLSISIIRMVSSNKKPTLQNENSDNNDNKQELDGIISPFFETCKNLFLLILQKK